MATYAEVLTRLVTARRFGVVLGLSRMETLLRALGSPDARLGCVVHVGGTNGKGSTVAMLAHVARTAGLRVATYTSPHLSTIRERITVDGEMIDGAAFVAAAERVRAAGGDELTFFEQLTALACVAIADAAVDVTILEVGLGGRLDATNAVRADVAVVTGVAMDHEAILGDTLEKIAAEKAGIFATGQRIVVGASGVAAGVPVLVAAARAVGVEPVVVDEARIASVPPVALPGAHQRANAAAVIAACDALGEVAACAAHSGAAWTRLADPETRARGLATVVHPGRFEVVPDAWISPAPAIDLSLGDVILDGAHNPHGAAALAAALREQGVRPTLVLAVSADKDVRAIVRALLPAVGAVVATRYRQDRSLDPQALARIVADVSVELGAPREVLVEHDLDHAFASAAARSARILVAGSLFLVGEARSRLLGVPTDPFVATDPPITPR